MKKLFSLVLALLMAGALAACGNPGGVPNRPSEPSAPPSVGQPAEETPTIRPDENDEETPSVQPEDGSEDGSRVLVAYFSATGNTAGVAELIAAHLSADTYEIIPEVPYTDADLDYNTDCRANREQDDPSARPAISGSVEGLEAYDVIFLGYPIWWGVPPKIMHTFVESCDFRGKTVIPFCTSGSSGYNDSGIKDLASDADWVTGRRFSGDADINTVITWVDELNIR